MNWRNQPRPAPPPDPSTPAHRTWPARGHYLEPAAQLDRLDLLIVDEFGHLSFGRGGAELLSQVFVDRHERRLNFRLAPDEKGARNQGYGDGRAAPHRTPETTSPLGQRGPCDLALFVN